MSKMNKIGFTILTLFAFLTISCSCQNFFWSHSGSGEVQITQVKYGFLYNGYAIEDARKLSSSDDWYIPNNTQWTALVTYVGSLSGDKLRETGTVYWVAENGATNEYGFNGRGNGYRNTSGTFGGITSEARYKANNSGTPKVYFRLLFNSDDATTVLNPGYLLEGGAVRFARTATGQADLTEGTYTGNDGKVYRTVVINEIEYTDNLAETKYRNGDWITGYDGGVYTPISNATWTSLTTGALAAYNDDETNVLQ